MKITTDVNSGGIKPAENVFPRSTSGNRSSNISDAKVTQDVLTRMQREKTAIDALVIAQSSRELVQKALNVSARLMSLASEAMVSGRVNNDEVSSQVSIINGSMGNYGESLSVAVPAGGTAYTPDAVQKKIDDSFVRLKEAAVNMSSGKPSDKRDFEAITANLKELGSELDVRINKISAELGNVKRIGGSGFSYSGMNRDTADMILRNPVQSFGAQGNISYDMAGKLTMA